jgi:hypothetical protein
MSAFPGRKVMLASELLAVSQNGLSAQDVSVPPLPKEGHAAVGGFPSPAGPGPFLQKGDPLLVCFVAEKPSSPALVTRYCKPVKS